MCRIPTIVLFSLLFASVAILDAYAQTEHVYLVKSFGCSTAPRDRSQTGFRAQGIKGVFTALHGVAGCNTIKVQSEQGVMLFEKLSIIKADAKNDVALLSSAEIDNLGVDGLVIGQNAQLTSFQTIQVIGHPFGIKALNTQVTLRNPHVRPLKDLLETDVLGALNLRRSPDPNIEVLSIQGTILPGHSGAPLLDANNSVIGIANGGLRGGTSGITWAIPFNNLALEVISNNRLLQIAQSGSGSLFSFDENVPPRFPIRVERKDSFDKGDMETQVTISSNGRLDSVTKIKSTNDVWGFCGRIAFWLFGKNNQVLGVYGKGNQWCVDGRKTPWSGPKERSDILHIEVPKEILNQTYSATILHTLGSKDPLKQVQENIQKATNIKKLLEE